MPCCALAVFTLRNAGYSLRQRALGSFASAGLKASMMSSSFFRALAIDDMQYLGSGTDMPLHGRLELGEHVLTLKRVGRGDDGSDFVLSVDGLDASANTASDRWPTVAPEACAVFENEVKARPPPPMNWVASCCNDVASLAFRRRVSTLVSPPPNPTSLSME